VDRFPIQRSLSNQAVARRVKNSLQTPLPGPRSGPAFTPASLRTFFHSPDGDGAEPQFPQFAVNPFVAPGRLPGGPDDELIHRLDRLGSPDLLGGLSGILLADPPLAGSTMDDRDQL
jgi:hypothetical protein